MTSQKKKQKKAAGGVTFYFPDANTVSDKPLKLFTRSERQRPTRGRCIKSEAIGAEVLIK